MGARPAVAVTIPAAAAVVVGDTPEWDRIIAEYADRLTAAGVDTWAAHHLTAVPAARTN